MAKSATQCVNTNDFMEALARFNMANARWKEHWFNACEKITKKCKEWANKYTLNRATLTIEKMVKKAKETVRKVMRKHNGASYVYLIKMFDDAGQYVFLKGGKADSVSKRLKDLSKTEYKRDGVQINRVEIIKTWELPSSHLAESFEQALHAYLCQFFDNIPNDRYHPQELTEEQFAELDRRHKIISSFG